LEKKRAEQILSGNGGGGGEGRKEKSGEEDQTMYIHVSKCKNNKIKGEKKVWLFSLLFWYAFCQFCLVFMFQALVLRME
jgi:hypothetical protein